MKNNRIVLLGDSITEGIGSKKINCVSLLNKRFEIFNLALTGTTINYVKSIYEKIREINPSKIIIMYGNVDVQFRPNMEKNRFGIVSIMPKHYKEIKGILNPRPFYSKNIIKKIINIIDNVVRKFLKKLVVVTQGYCQYLNSKEFINEYNYVIERLLELKPKVEILCISTVYLDDKIYNNSSTEYRKINEDIKRITEKYENVNYIDIYTPLKEEVEKNGWNSCYYLDHFHPNSYGYKLIAKQINSRLFF